VGPEVWTQEQERRVGEVVAEGRFRTIGEAVAWGRRELDVAVSYKKFGTTGFGDGVIGRRYHGRWRRRRMCRRRSVGEGGLWAALQTEGLRRGEAVVFADEMQLGLLGQVR
jgi:hypothetical protein